MKQPLQIAKVKKFDSCYLNEAALRIIAKFESHESTDEDAYDLAKAWLAGLNDMRERIASWS